MYTAITAIFSGLMSGFVGPLMTLIGKTKDDNLAGAQTGMGTDAASYAAYLQAYVQVQQLKQTQNAGWMAKIIGCGAGFVSLAYYGAIALDSIGHFGWQIAKMPGQWDADAWIILQSFIIVAPVVPVTSALAAWLHRK